MLTDEDKVRAHELMEQHAQELGNKLGPHYHFLFTVIHADPSDTTHAVDMFGSSYRLDKETAKRVLAAALVRMVAPSVDTQTMCDTIIEFLGMKENEHGIRTLFNN